MLTRTDIEKYFSFEKQAALIFLAAGAVIFLFAIISWLLLKTYFWKGVALPAGVAGLLLLAVCYPTYQQSDEQRISNVYAFDMNPDLLKYQELPRMKGVTSRFIWLHAGESALVIAGIVLIVLFRNKPEQAFWYGVGCSLAAIAAALLITDIFAARQAAQYTRQLNSLFKH